MEAPHLRGNGYHHLAMWLTNGEDLIFETLPLSIQKALYDCIKNRAKYT